MKSFLIAEDDPTLFKMYEHMLKLRYKDASVIQASNGKEALEKAREREPSAILSDIDMPVMDGIDFHKALKKEFPSLARRTGFISGSDSKAYLSYIEGENLPFLLKPFKVEDLFAIVELILESEEEQLKKELGNMCQRVYERKKVRGKCLLTPIGTNKRRLIKGEIINISEEGFGFRYKEEIFSGGVKVIVSSAPLKIAEREAQMVWANKANGDVNAGFRWT